MYIRQISVQALEHHRVVEDALSSMTQYVTEFPGRQKISAATFWPHTRSDIKDLNPDWTSAGSDCSLRGSRKRTKHVYMSDGTPRLRICIRSGERNRRRQRGELLLRQSENGRYAFNLRQKFGRIVELLLLLFFWQFLTENPRESLNVCKALPF